MNAAQNPYAPRGVPSGRIVFLSVPESLRCRIEESKHEHCHHDDEDDEHEHYYHEHEDDEYEHHHDDDFTIDPSIPIPVELRPGETSLDLEQLSWEMIISGMLRVISDHTADLEEADINYYRRFVLSVRPGILEEFTEAAVLHARNGDFAPALEILTILRGLYPGAPGPLLNQALIMENQAESLEQAGREAEAEAAFKTAHEYYRSLAALEEPFPEGLFNAGYFYMKRNNFDKARECFAAYLPLAEDDEKYRKAQRIVREIQSRSLDDEIFREAYDFVRMGEEQKGLEKIRDFLERHSEVWNGWFILGWALRRLGRWEDGAVSLRKAVELGGGNCDTRNELAICLMEKGDYAAARKELELALREESENVKIISNLGVLALKTGDRESAGGFFRTVLEFDPEDPIAKQYLENQ
jgi:tetratricopeptide (TPR) repeat protein